MITVTAIFKARTNLPDRALWTENLKTAADTISVGDKNVALEHAELAGQTNSQMDTKKTPETDNTQLETWPKFFRLSASRYQMETDTFDSLEKKF